MEAPIGFSQPFVTFHGKTYINAFPLNGSGSSSSASEEEEEQVKGGRQPMEKADCQVVPAAASKRKSYALKLEQLLPDLRKLLGKSRSFFTREHSLERAGPKVSKSTFDRNQERILSKSPLDFPWAEFHFSLRTQSLRIC